MPSPIDRLTEAVQREKEKIESPLNWDGVDPLHSIEADYSGTMHFRFVCPRIGQCAVIGQPKWPKKLLE